MYLFGNDTKARGCFTRFDVSTALSSGAKLRLPDGISTLPVSVSADEPMLVTSVGFASREKFHLVECFEDTTHIYAFGHDPRSSMIQVGFVCFLTSSDGTEHSNGVRTFLKTYDQNRLSNAYSKKTQVIFGGTVLQGFLVGMESRTADPHHNLQQFSYTLLATETFEGATTNG